MSDEQIARYKLIDVPIDGRIVSMEEIVAYSTGHLRNLIVTTKGLYDDAAMVPITVFGDDARNLNETDLQRPITCMARLSSRRYTNKYGTTRWALSFAAYGVKLGPHTEQGTPTTDETSANSDWANDADDIPF